MKNILLTLAIISIILAVILSCKCALGSDSQYPQQFGGDVSYAINREGVGLPVCTPFRTTNCDPIK